MNANTEYLPNPTTTQIYLQNLKPFLTKQFNNTQTKQQEKKRGRPSLAPFWLLVALGIIRVKTGLSYRAFHQALNNPQIVLVLKKHGATKTPSKSTLHAAWNMALHGKIRDTVNLLAKQLHQQANHSPQRLAVDSTGFELKPGSTWRLLKWGRALLKKPSEYYNKGHVLGDVASKAVLSLSITS